MATEVETPPAEVEKVYDIGKMAFVDKVATEEKPTEQKPTEETKPEVKLEEQKPAETPPIDGKKPEEVKPEDKPTPTFEPGAYLDTKYGEKYGIKSEDDLEGVLSSTETLVKNYEALQNERNELKKKVDAGPFRNDQEKKIAEFLGKYDSSRFSEGLNTVASVMGMDPANAGENTVLEEAFILKHTDLSRDEAKDLFAYENGKKYSINKEDFDSDEKFNQQKRILDIQKKNEVAAARRELLAKQAELKAAPEPKTEKPAEEKPVAEAPKVTVEQYTNDVNKFLSPEKNKVFDRINYMSDDGKETLFSLVLDPEKQAGVKEFMLNTIKNPAFYDASGKITNFDTQELARTAIRILYGDWQEEQLWKSVKTVAAKMKAEQIASASLEKRSTGGGDSVKGIDDQFADMAAKAKAERATGRR